MRPILVVLTVVAVVSTAAAGKPPPAGVTKEQAADAAALQAKFIEVANVLAGVKADCKKGIRFLEDDDLAEASRLMTSLDAVDGKDPAVKAWVDELLAVIGKAGRATFETKDFQRCLKNPEFVRAARAHPMGVIMVPKDAKAAPPRMPKGVTKADVKLADGALAAWRALQKKLRSAGKNCATAAKVVKADTNATTAKRAALHTRLQGNANEAIATWYFEHYVDKYVEAATERPIGLWRACSTDNAFMNAALAHPFLKVTAAAFDDRVTPQPKSVTKQVLADTEANLVAMEATGAAMEASDDCKVLAKQLAPFIAARDSLLARLRSAALSDDAKTWLGKYASARIVNASSRVAVAGRACKDDPGFKAAAQKL